MHHLLDRAVPDRIDTHELPPELAAEVDHLAGRHQIWWGEEVPPALAARALVARERWSEARARLADVDPSTVGGWPVAHVVAATWAAARVGPRRLLGALAAQIGGLADDFLVDRAAPLGPRDTHLGMAAAACGQPDRAVELLSAGVAAGDRRAPVWGAIARLEQARVLRGLPEPRDEEAAAASFSAQLFLRAGGYQHLNGQARASEGPVEVGDHAAPRLAHLVPGPTWVAGFGVELPVAVRPSKGLRALHHLVQRPGRPVVAEVLHHVAAGTPVPDDLTALLNDGLADPDELHSRLADDRARSRTSKLLRRTIDHLGEEHGSLGHHLRGSIRTGYVCRYEPRQVVRWRC